MTAGFAVGQRVLWLEDGHSHGTVSRVTATYAGVPTSVMVAWDDGQSAEMFTEELAAEPPGTATYPVRHHDQCWYPYCCGSHTAIGYAAAHDPGCDGNRGPRLAPTGEADRR